MTIGKTVFFYAVHLLAGTVGVILPVFLMLVTVDPAVIESFRPLVDFLFGEPFFPLDILLGFFLAFCLNRRLGHGFARWVWILPAIRLAYTIATWNLHVYSTLSYWEDIWVELFGSGGSSTEGVYLLRVTLPFYTSVAYSLGAHFGYRRWRARNADKRAPQTAGA